MSRMTRTRSCTSLALAFEEYNPRHPITWRWELAGKLAGSKKRERPGRADPLLARAARFQRRLARCRSPGRLAQLQRAEPDMFQAHDFHLNGGWPRVILEARLLAQVPIPEIAARHGLSEEAVQLYTNLFFDVLPRLNARDWILSLAIGRPRRDESELEFAARQVKSYAYFMGPVILDLLVNRVFDRSGALLRDVLDLGTADGRLTAKARFAVDIDRPGKSLSYWITQLENWARLQEIEKLATRRTPEPEQLLIDVALAEERLGPAPVAHHDAEEQPEVHAAGGAWKLARIA